MLSDWVTKVTPSEWFRKKERKKENSLFGHIITIHDKTLINITTIYIFLKYIRRYITGHS